MLKLKIYIFTALIILMVFISNIAMSQESQYSSEMIAKCLQLSEGIDTSEWVIDENLPVLDDSNLNALDDGWNKKIKEAHQQMLEICSHDEESDECWLSKNSGRKLKKERKKCYYGLLMKAI